MKVGQKVVCIDGQFNATYGEVVPVNGELYTVREVFQTQDFLVPVAVRLVEIVNDPRNYCFGWMECGFDARQFRVVDSSFGEEVAEKIEKEMVPVEIFSADVKIGGVKVNTGWITMTPPDNS